MRTQSHSQLMHLLSTSASDGASGLPQHHMMTSSDEEYGGQGYLNESQRSVLRRNRHDGHYHHHRNHADLETGLIRAGGSNDDAEPASLSSRAANVLGLSSWFRYSTPSPPPQKQRVPRSLPTSSAPTRTPSEDESGFDSDSEPEPTHVGPQPKRRAKGTNEERQSLLKHDQKAADRGRGPQRREANGKGYGAATPDGKTAVRDVTPGGRTASALENVAAKVDEGSLDRRFKQERTTAHLIAEEKKLATVGSMSSADGDFDRKDGYQQQRRDGEASTTTAYDEEARDEVADLPGGKRERERLALRRAVPGWQEAEEGEEKSVQFAININLFINVLLLAGKGIAVLSSSSVSLLASLVDSALDLLSTLIIFGASKLVAFKSAESYFKYPRGKKNFEPLGVVIFSVLMIASFCQVLVESIERLRGVLTRGSDPEDNTALPWIGIAFMVATIGIKTIMWLLYRKSKSAGVRAVAQGESLGMIRLLHWSMLTPSLDYRRLSKRRRLQHPIPHLPLHRLMARLASTRCHRRYLPFPLHHQRVGWYAHRDDDEAVRSSSKSKRGCKGALPHHTLQISSISAFARGLLLRRGSDSRGGRLSTHRNATEAGSRSRRDSQLLRRGIGRHREGVHSFGLQ